MTTYVDPCPDETAAYNEAKDAYNDAWWNELSAELNIWGAALSTVGGAGGTVVCFAAVGASAPGTFGASTMAVGGCWAAATATAGGAAWTGSAWIAEGPYEKATAAAKEAMDEAGQAWCDCAHPGGEDGGDPGDSGVMDTADAGELDDAGDDAAAGDEDEDEDAGDEDAADECECEEGDAADQAENYSSSPEADDTALMSTYDPNNAP